MKKYITEVVDVIKACTADFNNVTVITHDDLMSVKEYKKQYNIQEDVTVCKEERRTYKIVELKNDKVPQVKTTDVKPAPHKDFYIRNSVHGVIFEENVCVNNDVLSRVVLWAYRTKIISDENVKVYILPNKESSKLCNGATDFVEFFKKEFLTRVNKFPFYGFYAFGGETVSKYAKNHYTMHYSSDSLDVPVLRHGASIDSDVIKNVDNKMVGFMLSLGNNSSTRKYKLLESSDTAVSNILNLYVKNNLRERWGVKVKELLRHVYNKYPLIASYQGRKKLTAPHINAYTAMCDSMYEDAEKFQMFEEFQTMLNWLKKEI